MIKQLKKLGQTGDTIVEVMIVLAVLGLALSISYATANRGLQQSRNAQEHSQALGIINSQVELLRSAFARQAGSTLPSTGIGFCLAPPVAPQAVDAHMLDQSADGFKDDINADHLTSTAYPGPCTQNTLYYVSIMNRGNGVYDFRVRWNGLGDLGRQQEELTYKVSTVTLGGGDYGDSETPPPPPFSGAITVSVKAIPQTGPSGTSTDPTPPCSNPAGNKSGTTVRMNGTGGPFTKSTDGSSNAAFTNLQQGDSYTASISRSGWQLCSGGGSAVASATAPVPVINATIRPICSISYYNNYYDYYRDAGLDGWWKFGNSTPDSAYTSSYYDQYGGFHTAPYPWYWYYVGSTSYQWINGSLYRYYWVYDAYYHSIPIYGCPS